MSRSVAIKLKYGAQCRVLNLHAASVRANVVSSLQELLGASSNWSGQLRVKDQEGVLTDNMFTVDDIDAVLAFISLALDELPRHLSACQEPCGKHFCINLEVAFSTLAAPQSTPPMTGGAAGTSSLPGGSAASVKPEAQRVHSPDSFQTYCVLRKLGIRKLFPNPLDENPAVAEALGKIYILEYVGFKESKDLGLRKEYNDIRNAGYIEFKREGGADVTFTKQEFESKYCK